MSRILRIGLLVCFGLVLARAAQAEHQEDAVFNYHWGRGLNIAPANLNIGGYLQASYARPERRRDNFTVNDLSLFITWSPFDRLRLFAEIDQHAWLSSREVSNFGETLSIERLFAEFLISESTTLRFGKFLTPFGRWNVIHSAPLVWTTNRPIITQAFSFAPRANGLQLNHNRVIDDHNFDFSLYLDDTRDLEPKSNTTIFDKAIGSRINFEVADHWQIGASYIAYQKLADLGSPTHHVFGADAMWQYRGYELLFESLYHTQEGHVAKDEKGLFVQGVVPLVSNVSLVGRYEYFNSSAFINFSNESSTHLGVNGIAWRPFVPLVFKAEYRYGLNNRIIAPSGLFISVAMFY